MNLATSSNRITPRTSCARLRWKGMFVDVDPDPSVPNPRDGFCWCSLTHTCLGPDGGVVVPPSPDPVPASAPASSASEVAIEFGP